MTAPVSPLSTAPQRITDIIAALKAAHPDAHCELNYRNPFELLIATIMSAQTTDVRVNSVTPALFETYPTPAKLAAAKREDVEAIIRPTGTYRNKARFIQETAQMLVDNHAGNVPQTVAELTALTGVARKTANVVLGECFGIANGIVVDTHVKRLAKLLGLTEETNPVKVERDLQALVPHDDWIIISHLLIFHGRRVCIARRPQCSACTIRGLCPSALPQ